MANLNVSETVEIDRSSLAGRIIAAGDSGLPRDTVEIYYQFDVRQRERREDPNISDRYRSELERQDREQTEAALVAAEENDIAAARKALEVERAQHLAQIKSDPNTGASQYETSNERQGREARQTVAALRLNSDLLGASMSGDVDGLADMFDELLIKNDPVRVRQIAPVIVARLRALAGENASSDTTFLMATTRYNSWKAQNTSSMERLRSIDEKLKTVEAPIRGKHQQMREYFRWGKDAYGQKNLVAP